MQSAPSSLGRFFSQSTVAIVAIGAIAYANGQTQEKPYTSSQRAQISAWMNRHRPDAAWIDPVRDHIVAQGMFFRGDNLEHRLYVVRGLKPSQVLSRTMWQFLRQGFELRPTFANISHKDLPKKTEPDQFFNEYMPTTWSYGDRGGTGSYKLRDFMVIHVSRDIGPTDVLINEDMQMFTGAAFQTQKMQAVYDELGFNPKRGVETPWPKDLWQLLSPVVRQKPPASKAHHWDHNSSEPWLDKVESHIVSKTYSSSDKDERREYVLKGMRLSQVARAIQSPLARLGFQYTYGGAITSDIDANDFETATFMPRKWNSDAAKLGLVAVEAVHDAGARGTRIIELYGLPVK